MPRNLPWLTAATSTNKRESTPKGPPSKKRARHSTPDDLVDSELNTTGVVTPERRKALKPPRSPSTSPLPAPPNVQDMHAGFHADDIWMMVEDEFLTTAQKFTQHIHRAEYDRLRRLARSRGDRTLRSIERGTDGKTAPSTSLKMKLEADGRAKKIKDEMSRAMGDESEEEDAYMMDANLAGLMGGSQALGRDLRGMAKAQSNTRAAAGFVRSPRKPNRVSVQSIERDVEAMDGASPRARHGLKDANSKDNETETDSDDLDTAPKLLDASQSVTKFNSQAAKDSQISKRFTQESEEVVTSTEPQTSLSKREILAKTGQSSDNEVSSSGNDTVLPSRRSDRGERPFSTKLRTKHDQETKRDQEKRKKQKSGSDVISVPMWL